MTLIILFSAFVAFSLQKDPAQGWTGYAEFRFPSHLGKEIITHVEAKWKVNSNPQVGGAFYSPWFGIETSDNMNLLQPVNPWEGSYWQAYTEYFQWQPVFNQNSNSISVQTGDILHGSVTYNASTESYHLQQGIYNNPSQQVGMSIPIQQDGNGQLKKYQIIYFVMEKVWACSQYSPDGITTFFDIKVEVNHKPIPLSLLHVKLSYVDDNCNSRAHYNPTKSPDVVTITWDTSLKMNHTLFTSATALHGTKIP